MRHSVRRTAWFRPWTRRGGAPVAAIVLAVGGWTCPAAEPVAGPGPAPFPALSTPSETDTQLPAVPPAATAQVPVDPKSPALSTPSETDTQLPAVPPAATAQVPAVPPAATAQVPAVPPAATAQVPAPQLPANLAEQLAESPSFGGSGLRETYADIPNLAGDGCAPNGFSGQVSVGRICVTAPIVPDSDRFILTGPALLEGVKPSAATFNSAQGVAPSFNSSYVLPSTNLGSVSGPPPTTLTGNPPASGPYAPSGSTVTPVSNPPSSFLAAADNAFRSNPNLTTGAYPTASMQTKFDAASSGVVTAPGTSGPSQAFLYYDYLLNSPIILPGYAVGFIKLTENFSPLPRDRVYMNYSYFNNANFFPTQADVNRFMPGFEKTFFDGWTSIELRTPFAATLSNSQQFGPQFQNNVSEYRDIQFGNMSLIFKTLLVENRTWAITAGLQTMLPTAANVQLGGQTMFVDQTQSIQSVYAANESVHLMPFVGSVWAPNSRFFNQALLQFDRDVNGTPVYVNGDQKPGISGRQLDYAGRVFYPTFMYLSFGTGYWLYKDDTQNFTGFSPILELHVNQALEEFCPVQYQGWQLGPNLGTVSVTNALVGCNFEWGTRQTLSFGYVTPLGGGADRFFDGELRAMYNWRFGPQNALRRAQF